MTLDLIHIYSDYSFRLSTNLSEDQRNLKISVCSVYIIVAVQGLDLMYVQCSACCHATATRIRCYFSRVQGNHERI